MGRRFGIGFLKNGAQLNSEDIPAVSVAAIHKNESGWNEKAKEN